MKRRELILALIGALLLLPGLYLGYAAKQSVQEEQLVAGSCLVPVTILGNDRSENSAIVFHGLSANRKLMLTLGRWLTRADAKVYLVEFPGHGDNPEPFSFEHAESCAATLLEMLERTGEIKPEKTVLVGHSMGGAIAIRMADVLPVAGTVAISPAPLVSAQGVRPELLFFSPPHRMPSNLLLIVGGLEPGFAEHASTELLKRAGGERKSTEDFFQRRAAALRIMPGATHTSLIKDPRVALEALLWMLRAFGEPLPSGVGLYTNSLVGAALGFLGLVLLFPACASLFARRRRHEESAAVGAAPLLLRSLVAWALAAGATAAFLRVGVPLSPLVRMYSGNYLASVLMMAGVVLLATQKQWAGSVPPLQLKWFSRGVGMAAVFGVATMLAFGAWLDWQITDAWLNAPRWWRFALLVPLVLPYFLAEEIALGAPQAKNPWRAKASRYLLFLGLRGLLWLAMLFGLVLLQSGEVLMALLVIYMAAFSIGQRMGMDAVRRRTGSAAAAAVFGAILAAWFIAAVFPIT